MKRIILKTAAVLLILAGGFASCGNKENNEEKNEAQEMQGNVPYMPCDCGGKEVTGIELPKEALLVADSVSDRKDGVAYYAVFNSHKSSESERIIVNICNFPDFAKKWDGIFLQGREVYLSGKLYNTCYELPRYGFERSFDMILTDLKLK